MNIRKNPACQHDASGCEISHAEMLTLLEFALKEMKKKKKKKKKMRNHESGYVLVEGRKGP